MTQPERVSAAIPIPGWEIEHDDGDFIATRQGMLSTYQMQLGALERVVASNAGELWILCDAQTRLAERLTTAEEVATREQGRVIAELPSAGGRGGDVGSGPGPRLA